jgi:hypothetical protein
MESMENHKAGFPPFPHSLEIPVGFPHYHGFGDEYLYSLRLKTETQKKLVTMSRLLEIVNPGRKFDFSSCEGFQRRMIPAGSSLLTSPRSHEECNGAIWRQLSREQQIGSGVVCSTHSVLVEGLN